MIRALVDAARRVLGRPAVRAWEEIDCQDGVVRIEPSPFFNDRIVLSVDPDVSNVRPEQMPVLPGEARRVAAALIAAALEVERDG